MNGKRKHIRTRKSFVSLQRNHYGRTDLTPGLFRILDARRPQGAQYVASFIVNADHTVEFYGLDLIVAREDE